MQTLITLIILSILILCIIMFNVIYNILKDIEDSLKRILEISFNILNKGD